ncbi:TIGR01457 family HAD-type hydrolase [Halalkalibacillus sediminis]|uniref:TIGR01457 family HAD-type hydrolase n=1 Tax=Halalkalibacillus sediminis TaxID=2018042 RepID=A0A2I0QUS2_9BACI|nr:TIGR01457 family HAD-type hydrolase [Halalkalibacillus sediminis]PKR78102.1 TIGR01457 family HAD-type hydrolase [Halalkalibacillus sediminis]
MKNYSAYLIDLDGTMYRGKEVIAEARQFIEHLQANGIPYRYVTNNSSRTPEDTAKKLQNFGIEASVEQIVTASMAAAAHIKSHFPEARAFAIGERGLTDALKEVGIEIVEESPDVVIMGIDRENNYKKLRNACLYVQQGAEFLATNPDIKVPTEKGLVPGNGAFIKLVENVTGVEPTVIGKPKRHMIDFALEQIGANAEDTIMVGDNYDTDILAGMEAGLDTLHVHTGVTTLDEIKNKDRRPTYSIETLEEWFK